MELILSQTWEDNLHHKLANVNLGAFGITWFAHYDS